METVCYWGTGYALWWFVLRHISHALSEAISESMSLARLDFTDDNQVSIKFAQNYSSWDKLWLVPRRFRIVFVRELIDHWKYY